MIPTRPLRDIFATMTRSQLRSVALPALGLATLVLVGCGPLGPFAGGRLSGELGPAKVSSWDFASGEARAQLETRPSDPHSINVWFASSGGALYVPTSMILGPTDPRERDWVSHVAADPRVRLRLAGRVFERRMVRVDDPSEFAQARAALETKYELDPDGRDPEREVWIFRLDPR